MDTLLFVLLNQIHYTKFISLKSLSDKFLINASRLEFINYMLSIKANFY